MDNFQLLALLERRIGSLKGDAECISDMLEEIRLVRDSLPPVPKAHPPTSVEELLRSAVLSCGPRASKEDIQEAVLRVFPKVHIEERRFSGFAGRHLVITTPSVTINFSLGIPYDKHLDYYRADF